MKMIINVILTWIAILTLFGFGLYIRSSQRSPEPKDCLDYTLAEYREGEAPGKCQAEVYGDQF